MPMPAYVRNGRFNILAANALGRALMRRSTRSLSSPTPRASSSSTRPRSTSSSTSTRSRTTPWPSGPSGPPTTCAASARRTQRPSRLHSPDGPSPQVSVEVARRCHPKEAELQHAFGTASRKQRTEPLPTEHNRPPPGRNTGGSRSGHLTTGSKNNGLQPLEVKNFRAAGRCCGLVAGEGFEPSKLSRRIYSPLPLAARATCRCRVPRQVTTWSGRQQTKG